MIVGVPKETISGERRVALVPELVAKLGKSGLQVLMEPGAGAAAGFLDQQLREAGAQLETNVFEQADVLLKVQAPTPEETAQIKEGTTLIGFLQPYTNIAGIQTLASRNVTSFA